MPSEALSKYMAELWKVHIFREGNTRTIVTFVCQYTESIGIMLDTELFEKNSVYVRSALVAASAVFKDLGDRSKPQYLVKIIKDALNRGESDITEECRVEKRVPSISQHSSIYDLSINENHRWWFFQCSLHPIIFTN